jgi:hypothetical protein
MSFKQIVAIIFIIFVSGNIFAQEGKWIFKNRSFDQFYETDFQYDVGSHGLNNSILFKFGLGGFIDDNLKLEVLNRLNTINYFGQYAHYGITYRQENRRLLGLNRMGLQFSAHWNNFSELAFTEDAFKAVFYGNNNIDNGDLSLSKSGINTLNYYQIKLGLNRFSSNAKHQVLVNLAFNLGNDFKRGRAENAGLFTSILGDSISLYGDFDYYYLNRISTNPFDVYGFGAGLDLIYKYKDEENIQFEFSVQNLGFIKWNSKYQHLNYSQPIIWKGVEIENILQMPNEIFGISAGDSIKNFLTFHSDSGSYILNTPSDISVQLIKNINSKIQFETKLSHRFFSYFNPRIEIRGNFLISDNFTISPVISYGGYSRFNFGFEGKFKHSNGSQIKIGTNYLSGLIFSSQFSGVGGYISFTKQI